MGEAKRRGSREHRVKEALDRRPVKSMTCNTCNAEISQLEYFDTRGIPGLDFACSGKCPSCGNVTFGVQGEPQARDLFIRFLNERIGQPESVTQQPVVGPKDD